MTLDPIFNASLPIQIHVLTVIPAAVLGAWLLARRKGTPAHRLLGRLWMMLMVASSISSLFVHTIRMVGPFSPIHLLSIWVLISAFWAIAAIRAGNVRRHKQMVVGMYLGGIVGAGIFTILPGRIMNAVLFSGQSAVALAVVLVLFGLAFWPVIRSQTRRSSARA